MLPCCPALTLTLWLLSARDNTPELNGVSSPRPLLPYSHIAPTHSLRVCLSLSATPLNALTSSSTLNFPPLSLSLSVYLPLLSPLPIQSLRQEQCALACLGLGTLSSGIPFCCSTQQQQQQCPPFPFLPTVAVPLAPVSRGRQSAIGPPPMMWWATEITVWSLVTWRYF